MLLDPHQLTFAAATVGAVEQLFFDLYWSFFASISAVGAAVVARLFK